LKETQKKKFILCTDGLYAVQILKHIDAAATKQHRYLTNQTV